MKPLVYKLFWLNCNRYLSFLDPLKLQVGKEYNINNIKEFAVTEDFLGLDKSIIGCQNKGSINDCKTSHYIDKLMENCGCQPYNLQLSSLETDQVHKCNSINRDVSLFSLSNLGQIGIPMTVLESALSEDIYTVFFRF